MPSLHPAEARRSLLDGSVVALPTDTVPGLAVLQTGPEAGRRLAQEKGYREERPFSLHFSDLQTLQAWAPELPAGLAAWLTLWLPQGVTAVVPTPFLQLPAEWNWPWPKVGLRLVTTPAFRELDLPGPLLMTSINPAGESPLFGPALKAWLEQKGIPFLEGLGSCAEQAASTVVEFDPAPKIRRGEKREGLLKVGMRVLVLCTGNICRSPVGEVLLQRDLRKSWGNPAEQDWQTLGWDVVSAGTFAMPGGPASEHSVAVAQDRGLDLEAHRSQNLEDLWQEPWDLFLGMGQNHLTAVPPGTAADLFDPSHRPVPDPFGGPHQAYETMAAHLEEASAHRVLLWRRWPEGNDA